MAPATRQRHQDQAAKEKQGKRNESEARPTPRKRIRAAPRASKAVKKPRQDGAAALESDLNDREFMTLPMSAAKGIKETKMGMRRKASEITKLMKKQLLKETFGKDMPAVTESLLPVVAPFTRENNDNKTFHGARQCLASLHDLVKGYEILNQDTIDTQGPTRTQWDHDETNLRALSDSAMGAAFRILNSTVMPYAHGDVIEDRAKAGGGSDIDTMAAELLAEAEPQRGDVTWGMTARDLFQALSGAIKLLPEASQGLGSPFLG